MHSVITVQRWVSLVSIRAQSHSVVLIAFFACCCCSSYRHSALSYKVLASMRTRALIGMVDRALQVKQDTTVYVKASCLTWMPTVIATRVPLHLRDVPSLLLFNLRYIQIITKCTDTQRMLAPEEPVDANSSIKCQTSASKTQ